MINRIQMIGISTLVAGLSLLLPPSVARAQDSVFVTSTGNVGIGTSTPATRLDVRASSSGVAAGRVQNSSGTGYSGFEYLDENSTVNVFLGIDNAANTTLFNSINNHPIVILTESTERMRVTSAGDVGIGTSSPAAKLHVPSGEVRFDSSHFYLETHFNYPWTGHNYLRGTTIVADDGSNVGIGCDYPTSRLVVGGSAYNCSSAPWSRINAGDANWSSSSSRTFKENLSPVQMPDILEKIAGVGVYTYDFIKGPKDRIGLMAEDFHQVFGRGSDKEIDGSEVEMALWLAVKELTARIAVLETRLAEKAEAQ